MIKIYYFYHYKYQSKMIDYFTYFCIDLIFLFEYHYLKENKLFGWAVGGAWSYRRSAYKKMAEILAEKRGPRLKQAQMTCDDVYAMEPEDCKDLHQKKTPPMSIAAKEARDAIMSIFD